MDQQTPEPDAQTAVNPFLAFIPLLQSQIIQRLILITVTAWVGHAITVLTPQDQQSLVGLICTCLITFIATWTGKARATGKPLPPVALGGKRIAAMLNTAVTQGVIAAPTAVTAATVPVPVSKESIMSKVFIGLIPLDLLMGAVLEHGTAGDKTKQAARATEGLKLIAASKQILTGDVVDGINALAAAVQSSTALTIAESLALQNLISLGSGQLQLFSGTTVGALLGAEASAVANLVLAEATKVCVAYGGVQPATAPAAKTA